MTSTYLGGVFSQERKRKNEKIVKLVPLMALFLVLFHYSSAMADSDETFGNTTSWLTTNDILYIRGSGDMEEYSPSWTRTAKEINIISGVTSIANNAFSNYTLTSQAIDTVIFTFIAFWGVYPTDVFWSILITTYVFKVIVALLDTPFMYLSRKIIPMNEKKVI